MTNRISIGRYVEGKSLLHRLDPRIKIVTNVIFLACIFVLRSLIALAIVDTIFISLYLLSGARKIYIWSLLKFLIPITIMVFFFMSVFWPEHDNIFFEAPHFKIAKNTIGVTGRTTMRLFGMLIATTTVTVTTKPMDITRSIEALLKPLKYLKFPVHIISMVITLALQFMPVMLDHGKKVSEAQAARGLDTIRGGWITKIKGLKAVWIPIMAAAFTNSIALGAAMDARGYDPYAKRSRYITYQIDAKSVVYLLFALSVLACLLYVKMGVTLPAWWW